MSLKNYSKATNKRLKLRSKWHFFCRLLCGGYFYSKNSMKNYENEIRIVIRKCFHYHNNDVSILFYFIIFRPRLAQLSFILLLLQWSFFSTHKKSFFFGRWWKLISQNKSHEQSVSWTSTVTIILFWLFVTRRGNFLKKNLCVSLTVHTANDDE